MRDLVSADAIWTIRAFPFVCFQNGSATCLFAIISGPTNNMFIRILETEIPKFYSLSIFSNYSFAKFFNFFFSSTFTNLRQSVFLVFDIGQSHPCSAAVCTTSLQSYGPVEHRVHSDRHNRYPPVRQQVRTTSPQSYSPVEHLARLLQTLLGIDKALWQQRYPTAVL